MVDLISTIIESYDLNYSTAKHKFYPNIKIKWAYPKYFTISKGKVSSSIYISATILNAYQVIHTVLPWLFLNKINFKIISSLDLLHKLNNNFFGYINSGKFITIYPKNKLENDLILNTLHPKLNALQGIPIPYALKFNFSSVLYLNKFNSSNKSFSKHYNTLFLQQYIIINTIRRRARGGVFFALEVDTIDYTTKKVILKEAIKNSEIELNGFDAVKRLYWQYSALKKLNELNVAPKPLKILAEEDSFFLVIDYLEGQSLRERILKSNREFSISFIKDIILKIITLIEKLHFNNIYFMDLSPDNVIILNNGNIKLIDCDLCIIDNYPSFIEWNSGSPGFFPDTQQLLSASNNNHEWYKMRDIYAIGKILFSLLYPKWYQSIFRGTSLQDVQNQFSFLANCLPKKIKQIVDRSTLKIKNFQTISELKNMINKNLI